MRLQFINRALFLALLCSFSIGGIQASSVKDIFTIDRYGTIIVNNEFSIPLEGYTDIDLDPHVFYGKSEEPNCSMLFYYYKGWKDSEDGGDFTVIKILKKDMVLELQSAMPWINTPKGNKNYNLYKPSEFVLPIRLSNTSYAYLFFGYVYGACCPITTIAVVTDTDMKVVYNNSLAIGKIDQTADTFRMQLLGGWGYSSDDEFEDGHIWLENGVLKIELKEENGER